MPIRIAVHGAAGRMGRRLIAMSASDKDLILAAALDSPDHPQIDEDAGTVAGMRQLGLKLSATLDSEIDVVVDFSLPEPAEKIVEICHQRKIPLVVATTGFDEQQVAKIQRAASDIPLLWAPNMSLAVNLGMKLTEVAAMALKDQDADVEILERHHRFKEDAPSGTALRFGEVISDVMGQSSECHGRKGRVGKRSHHEIGYHAIRVGDNPGEHTIVFAMLGEMIEITVRATNRDCYASGALAAAKFLAGKQPGLYSMDDVLGL